MGARPLNHIAIALVMGATILLAGCAPIGAVTDGVPDATPAPVGDVLGRLPHTITVEERVVVFDRETVPETPRDEYSVREAATAPEPDEDPIAYIERILVQRLAADYIVDQPEFYDYTVSFYPLDDDGVSAFVRVSNIPDDAIGASEERFDLSFADEQWRLTWYGMRHFCRRPNQEFWAPVDELCP